MPLIVCDLDGTLSDHRHRTHLVGSGDWDAYHELLELDPPHGHVLDLLKANVSAGGINIFLTGRPVWYKPETMLWLEKNDLSLGDDYEDLWMRPKGDHRSDVDLKKALWEEARNSTSLIDYLGVNASQPVYPSDQEAWAANEKRLVLFLEDRDKLVAMWRDLGYTCWQTAMGEF